MATEIFNRQELKFVISREQYGSIMPTILEYMRLDKHNVDGKVYRLYNLYIDTIDYALIRHSMNKPTVYKEKIRIRSYTPFRQDNKVFLEMKKRYKKVTNKRRTQIVLRDALEFMKTGNLHSMHDYMNPQVISEFSVILKNHKYRPAAYISYDRMAFRAFEATSDLRITFDTNLFSKNYNVNDHYRLLDEDKLIMEIKSITNIPLWLVRLLDTYDIRKQSFSKYGTEYMRTLRERTGV